MEVVAIALPLVLTLLGVLAKLFRDSAVASTRHDALAAGQKTQVKDAVEIKTLIQQNSEAIQQIVGVQATLAADTRSNSELIHRNSEAIQQVVVMQATAAAEWSPTISALGSRVDNLEDEHKQLSQMHHELSGRLASGSGSWPGGSQ